MPQRHRIAHTIPNGGVAFLQVSKAVFGGFGFEEVVHRRAPAFNPRIAETGLPCPCNQACVRKWRGFALTRGSKSPPDFKKHAGFSPAKVEDIGCERRFLVRKTDQETTLRVELGLKPLGALRHHTYRQPVDRRIRELRPAVVKT